MPKLRSIIAQRLAAVALLMTACVAPALAAPLDVNLGFTSLPSAQGFTYVATGSHAGVPEASIFSVAGGVLAQNSMGQSNGVSGGGIFYQLSGGITTTETKQLRVRARCLAAEGTAANPTAAGGIVFGFTTGSVQYDVGLTPTRVCALTSAGQIVVGGTYDNTQFHDYLLDWTSPSSWRVYRDGVLVYTGSSGFAVTANRIFLGDGTGGANAHAEITMFEFIQDLATPVASSTWGRLKELYR